MEFNEADKKIITIKNIKESFIYFLIKDENVVYVGQTQNGLFRPFSHHDKNFDKVKIIMCESNELDIVEDLYIKKYKPIYNKQNNYKINFNLSRVRNIIRKKYNNQKFSIPDLKKILFKLKITINEDYYTRKKTISFEDYVKVMEYMKEQTL